MNGFAQAWVLGLLPLVPLAAIAHALILRHLRLVQAGIGINQPQLIPHHAAGRARLRLLLTYLALALLLVCIAGPRWGASVEQQRSRGANLLILVDCSRSMLAEDLHPNRLEAARRKMRDLVATSPEHRVALLPFAGVASLRCPLTGDHQAFSEMLADCDPSLFPAEAGLQGTAIGAAVDRALSLKREADRGQAIIVCSDGADSDSDAISAAAEAAKQAGVPVYGLFLGDTERKVSIDIDGQQVEMKADRSSLDQLAETSGGISVNASIDDSDIELIAKHIEKHVKTAAWQEERRIVGSERYIWFLLPAIVLAAIAQLIPTRRAMRKELT